MRAALSEAEIAEARRTLARHDAEQHSYLDVNDPEVVACMWCQS